MFDAVLVSIRDLQKHLKKSVCRDTVNGKTNASTVKLQNATRRKARYVSNRSILQQKYYKMQCLYNQERKSECEHKHRSLNLGVIVKPSCHQALYLWQKSLCGSCLEVCCSCLSGCQVLVWGRTGTLISHFLLKSSIWEWFMTLLAQTAKWQVTIKDTHTCVNLLPLSHTHSERENERMELRPHYGAHLIYM